MHVDKQPTRTCTRRCWECGRNIPERASLDSPAACVSGTINTAETELQDNRFVVKAIWRVNKVASSNSVHEKDHSGPRLMGLFLKSKPQVVVSIQSSFVVQLGRCYTETRRRCKAEQLFVCVFNSSPLWNNIKPSQHPIPPVALSGEGGGGRGCRSRDRLAVIRSILRLPRPISPAQTRRGATDLTEWRTGTLIKVLFVRLSQPDWHGRSMKDFLRLFHFNSKWEKKVL